MSNKEKICGIYKIVSPIDHIYIGQSRDIKYRKAKYKRLDCKKQCRLYNSIIKYGWDAHRFEILHLCNPDELDELEKFYIEKFDSFNTDYGMNLIKGGAAYGERSDETKKKNSVATKKLYEEGKKKIPSGEDNPMFGKGYKLEGERNGRYMKPVSEETRRKISEANKEFHAKNGAKKLSEEHKQKISEAHIRYNKKKKEETIRE